MTHITFRWVAGKDSTVHPGREVDNTRAGLKAAKLTVLFVFLMGGSMQMAASAPDRGWQCMPKVGLWDVQYAGMAALQFFTKASTQENLENSASTTLSQGP